MQYTRNLSASSFGTRPLHSAPAWASAAAALKRTYAPTPTPPPSELAGPLPPLTLAPSEHLPVSRIDERKVVIGFDTEEWTRLCVIYIISSRQHTDALPNESHHLWLRDHCRCPQCFHPVTKQRLFNTFEVCLRDEYTIVFVK